MLELAMHIGRTGYGKLEFLFGLTCFRIDDNTFSRIAVLNEPYVAGSDRLRSMNFKAGRGIMVPDHFFIRTYFRNTELMRE
jgi:hypothetical protein